MIWVQQDVRLSPVPRGFHLITRELERGVPELARIETGLAHRRKPDASRVGDLFLARDEHAGAKLAGLHT